jgi:hypothetical protein
MMKALFITPRIVLLVFTAWAVNTCTADPWPEPDSMQPGRDADETPAEDKGDDNEYSQDTTGGSEEDTSMSILEILIDQVYCSGPDGSGSVTVVGLAGTFPANSAVEIKSATDTVSGTAGQDGGLTATLSASPGETLELSVTSGAGLVASERIVAGDTENGAVGNGILGDGQVEVYDNADVIIRGSGAALAEGDLVVGGNPARSTGRAAPVSCNEEGCMFGLLIPGASGETVELFLVTRDSRAGHTDVQTVVLP